MSEQQVPVFQIQRVYMKEASLEQPNSPAILLLQEQPSVDIQLGIGSEQVADGIFEVSVTATVQTKVQDKTVFLAEVKQAGIFEIRNMPDEHMAPKVAVVTTSTFLAISAGEAVRPISATSSAVRITAFPALIF